MPSFAANLLRAVLIVMLTIAAPLRAQDPTGSGQKAPTTTTTATPDADASSADQGAGVTLQINSGNGKQKLGTALEIVLLMTLLAMAPALIMTMTCFTRIVVVLSFLKRAMSMQDLPPAMITTGFALFMTIFIMKPVVSDIYDNAYVPYTEDKIAWQEAAGIASDRMNRFMLAQTRETDLGMFMRISGTQPVASPEEVPFTVLAPAFVTSELKTAFQIGFLLFIPFLIIDLVVARVLMAMGMMMLSPVIVSLPFKIMLFVLVDGWALVIGSLASSFAM